MRTLDLLRDASYASCGCRARALGDFVRTYDALLAAGWTVTPPGGAP